VTPLPSGFTCHVANIGVKDDTDDFVVITAERPVPAAGTFTRSLFAGPSVSISREHLADLTAQAIVVVSKNANVANGPGGLADARELVAGVAARLGCAPDDVLVASTGVIGRRYPMDTIRAGVAGMPERPAGTLADDAARGIMTTDTVAKVASADVAGSPARVVGIAKGVGMIEPDMATMIAVVLTDADVAPTELDRAFRSAVDATFNCVSIDTDTSTSDTAVILASGAAGAVDDGAFADALHEVCLALTKKIAGDGEGAETLIEVRVDAAGDAAQAKRLFFCLVFCTLVKF
jgi:glutamate N-acetyltransferase/amino-acid N-acetyltransferase